MSKLNMFDEVYGALFTASFRQARAFHIQYQQQYPGKKTLHQEMKTLNEYWRLELGKLRRNTISERECLTLDTTPEAWLTNFKQYIVPAILKDNLPRQLDGTPVPDTPVAAPATNSKLI